MGPGGTQVVEGLCPFCNAPNKHTIMFCDAAPRCPACQHKVSGKFPHEHRQGCSNVGGKLSGGGGGQ
jgi:hypothetical protein